MVEGLGVACRLALECSSARTVPARLRGIDLRAVAGDALAEIPHLLGPGRLLVRQPFLEDLVHAVAQPAQRLRLLRLRGPHREQATRILAHLQCVEGGALLRREEPELPVGVDRLAHLVPSLGELLDEPLLLHCVRRWLAGEMALDLLHVLRDARLAVRLHRLRLEQGARAASRCIALPHDHVEILDHVAALDLRTR